jgi:UDP-2-acetamido-3-amino-2,3-dideoxy-glucuronate N-acetyltransferase
VSDLPRVAVVGCGYWGRNLVRNFAELGALAAVSDSNLETAALVGREFGVPVLDVEAALADSDIEAVVIAAPAACHYELAAHALVAGKHVFVEKPLALDVTEADSLCEQAESAGRTLMVGHLMQYHPAFVALRALVSEGALGRVQYVYSNRLNLGRIRKEEDILWSFAPHDVSMILSLIGCEPDEVGAVGASYLHQDIADVTTTYLAFPGGEKAHVFVSWLHPFKEQKLVVVGEEGMALLDDGEPWDRKLRLYPHEIGWRDDVPQIIKAAAEPIAIEPAEPLRVECEHFLDCIRSGSTPRTDGREGVRVLRVLTRAAQAMKDAFPRDSREPRDAFPDVSIHKSAYIDEDCQIGAGTRIWHFTHLQVGSRVGRGCTIGQNVVIGPGVTVGDNCRIQNNVSVYSGVTLEDGVFCGPSCVFTNVLNPRAEVERKDEFRQTRVGRGATIGANATIVCGHDIGEYAMVGAGAVVTTDVPAHALVVGVPARRMGWVSHVGERLGSDLVCPRSGQRYVEVDDELRAVLQG